MNKDEIVAKLIDPDADDEVRYAMEDDYQRYIMSMLLVDRQFLLHALDLIRPSYFVNRNHRTICKILFEHFEKYKTLPNKVFLSQGIRDNLKDDEKVLECQGELTSLKEYYYPGVEARAALENRILKFAKMQALRQAFRESFTLLSRDFESEATWDDVYDIQRQAVTIDRRFDKGLDYFNSADERYARMEEELEQVERFTTGFETLDNSLTGGGLSRGEIYGWIALSGVGKSLALVTAGVKNLIAGKKVLYLSCEMSADKVAERFDAQLANVAIWELLQHKDEVLKTLNYQVRDQEDKCRLLIQQFPAGTADVNTFKAYLAKLKMLGFIPDLVIVDYVGEMKDNPNLKTYESRFRIVRDLRGFATEEDFLCLTAFQPNRGARELQEKDAPIDDDNLADAFGQTRPMDGLWSINQSKKEKIAGVARGFIVKSRSGQSRVEFLIGFDQKTLRMYEISRDTYKHRMSLASDEIAKRTGKQEYDDIDRNKNNNNDNDD
jgi:replicative DNA helicase